MYIYVLDTDGRPLMPTTRRRHVEHLLRDGKARIATQVPFTIQLLEEKERSVQPLILGIDPGRTNIGAAVTDQNGNVLFSAVCQTRNKSVPNLMLKRRRCRKASRRGERKRRQRRARKYATVMTGESQNRRLPHYGKDKYVTVKLIKNTESKFCNRKRPKGWLTPTAEHLVRTHINLVHKVKKFLPITDVTMEVNRFAFMQLENPSVTGIDFQNGPLKGFLDVNEAVFQFQHGKCLMCKNGIEHIHHLKPISQSGSNTLSNLTGLCEKCHTRFHTEEAFRERVLEKKTGYDKKYGALSVLNQAIPYIWERLVKEYGASCIHAANGKMTYHMRKKLHLPVKSKKEPMHDMDAYLIACQGISYIPEAVPMMESFQICQFRRHDRALIKAQRERTYKLNKKTVAKNRRPRFEQEGPSLEDWYREQVQTVGKREADKSLSSLTVTASRRYYNNMSRIMPGAVFMYDGKRHVMSGQSSGGSYLRAVGHGTFDFKMIECKLVERNRGLVFL